MPPAMQNLRCGECAKLLARALGYAELQIKCPRCGTLNHMKAESLPSVRPERLEEGSCHAKPAVEGRRPVPAADS